MKIFKNQKGFTLIEMMIALAIIGILSVMAVPSYNKFIAHQRLNSAARTLLADYRGTRAMAIRDGWQYGIWVQSSTMYQVVKAPRSTLLQGGGAPTVIATRDFTSSDYNFYGVTMSLPTWIPIFQQSGMVATWNVTTTPGIYSTATAPTDITLTSPYGETKTVTMNVMGYSQIQ
jgi:prepilin-type N-terminal cleavage/methylation domain-containing protein